MKEIQPHDQDEVRNLKPDQITKESRIVFQKRPKKGQKIFEFNIKENTIKEAEFASGGVVSFTKAQRGKISSRKRIDINPGCIYPCALNIKNAIRQIKQTFPLINPRIIKNSHEKK